MRFTIQTQDFRKAIESTSHATSTSNLTPILENILIEAKDGKVVLTGNNLDMAIEYTVEEWVTIDINGSFTLSAKVLLQYISLVNDSEVTVHLESAGSVNLITKNGKTKLRGIEAEKFPSIPRLPDVEPIILNAQDFKWAIDKTLFSTADGSVRPMLAGIFMNPLNEKIIFASTDSFRLSDYSYIPKNPISHPPVIIPKKSAQEIARLINEDTEQIELKIHESQMLVKINSIYLTSRLLSGKFPDYTAFFPKEFQTRTTVNKSDFVSAIRQVNLIASKNNFNAKIRSLSSGEIEIFTGDTDIGTSLRTLSATVEWKEDTIGINSEYLLHALSVIKDDYVSFEYKNPLSPIIIRGVGSDNKESQEYRHLIMPLKI